MMCCVVVVLCCVCFVVGSCGLFVLVPFVLSCWCVCCLVSLRAVSFCFVLLWCVL